MPVPGRRCRVQARKSRDFATAVLRFLGLRQCDARLVSRVMVRSDLRGVSTHGLKFLPIYAKRLAVGGTKAAPTIRTVARGAWGVVLDGDAGMGQIGAMAAARRARDMARTHGVGFCVCRNTSHIGALAPYLLEVVGGRLVLGFTNTGPSMAPPGGSTPAVGNNCLGFATPIRGAPPLCLDMTTSVESWGKVRARIEKGEALPEGVALLSDGSWARDPQAALLHAVAAPLGGGKGFGLALLTDVLTAGLSGGVLSPDIRMLHRELQDPEGTCCAFLAFELGKLPGGRSLPRRLAKWRRLIKGGTRVPGTREVFLPGERSARQEIENRRRGLPLDHELREELNALAASCGLRRRL